MADNPFTPDFGRRPMHLVGQDDLLTDMGRALQVGPGAEGYTRVLLGHRGSGKTTLLATIGDTARASGMMVVDVEGDRAAA